MFNRNTTYCHISFFLQYVDLRLMHSVLNPCSFIKHCFRVLNDSNDNFYTLFSHLSQLNSNPLIPSKMSSSPIITHFYPLNYIFSIVFYTYFIISVSVLNFYILLILFPILWSPQNIHSLLNLPNYSNSRYTNPFTSSHSLNPKPNFFFS